MNLPLGIAAFFMLLWYCEGAATDEDVDCQGEYDAWSLCEPLEGHNTHYDKDDQFLFERGVASSSPRDCFHFQTFHVTRAARGNGKPCSHVDGSKRFRFCENCAAIPSVHHRQERPSAENAGALGIVIGALALIGLAFLATVCIRNIRKRSKPSQGKQHAEAMTQQRQQRQHQQPQGHPYLSNGVSAPPAIADEHSLQNSPTVRYPLEQQVQQHL